MRFRTVLIAAGVVVVVVATGLVCSRCCGGRCSRP